MSHLSVKQTYEGWVLWLWLLEDGFAMATHVLDHTEI